MQSEAEEKILQLQAGGSTDINAALSMAIQIAKVFKIYEDVKQPMIIFLTDGRPSSGITNNEVIKSNIRKYNEYQVPIYGLAFGDNADFDLIKDISTESGAFTKRIYESGNSFQQLVNYYKEISDPKLRNVNFQYIANGKKIPAKLVIGAEIENTYGKNEYVITGEFEDPNVKLEQFEIVTIGEDATSPNGIYSRRLSIDPCQYNFDPCFLDPQFPVPDISNPSPISKWEQSPSESFMERLWAFKKIKFLLNNDEQCKKGRLESCSACHNTMEMDCSKEAIILAINYNFVTKATSLVVESDDDYVKNGPIDFDAERSLWPTKKHPDINGNAKSIGNNHLTKLGPSNYPPNIQKYPTNNHLTKLGPSNYPTNIQKYPTNNHLTKLGPSNHPTNIQKYTTNNHLTKLGPSNYPTNIQKYPTNNHLTKLGPSNYPINIQKYPTNNQNYPTNIQISPDQGSYPRHNWISSAPRSKFTIFTLFIMNFLVLIQYNINI